MLRRGLIVASGILLVVSADAVLAGDILRGGAAVSARRGSGKNAPKTGEAAANLSQQNAQDRLARTTQALQSVRAMQASARAAAARNNNLGFDPKRPGVSLVDVPNGLAPNGLELSGAPVGALSPRQSSEGSGVTVTVQQTEQQALLSWKTFNIGRNTTLNFDQSAGKSDKGKWIAFNKVTDPSQAPSQILGSIKADGQVYVINQNGIIFGGASQVNVHTLVASALPINDNLLNSGLLNNPDLQFLFTALPQAAGAKGTAAFTPPAPPTDGIYGDVTVKAGAQLTAPTTAAKVGGRIALIGANVNNEGTISTPDGQTILAAGLQVGVTAHASSDPSLRGLDVFVGEVGSYAGTVKNTGLIEIPRGSVTMTGRAVRQMGAIESSTSVSLNGRIDLLANYNAVSNPAYDPDVASSGNPFLFASTGEVTLGPGSVSRILPEWASSEKAVGEELALRSQVNLQGNVIHLGSNATILAPNAVITGKAGMWGFTPSPTTPQSQFVFSGGQIYLDPGALIDVAGSTGVSVPLSQSILTVQLRGSELANSPLQRDQLLRAVALTIDVRKKGTYGGRSWVGTPLGDASGFVGLVERSAGQLTTAGGTVDLQAGGSIVLSKDSTIDVSGGWVKHEGGLVKTTRLLYRGGLIDIEDATPDRIYDGIYTAQFTKTHAKWGVSKTYTNPLAPTGERYEQAYYEGAAGGSLKLTAASMALDGKLAGATVIGQRQQRSSSSESAIPGLSSLALSFRAQNPTTYVPTSPTPPKVVFQWDNVLKPTGGFGVDAAGLPLPLSADRQSLVVLSPDLLGENGFGQLTVENADGEIEVPAGVDLKAQPKGSVTLAGSNIDVRGRISAPGGQLKFTAYNISPYLVASTTPPPSVGRGIFTLAEGASLSAAGLIVDDRPTATAAYDALQVRDGGSITIQAYGVDLQSGSVVDVSGGVSATSRGRLIYGEGGQIVIEAGQDPGDSFASVVGGPLTLKSTLKGYSRTKGGSLSVQANLIQVGGAATGASVFQVQPEFFNTGGFSHFTLSGLGQAEGTAPAVLIAPGTVIEPVGQSLVATPFARGAGGLTLTPSILPVGEREPVSLSFNALGVRDSLLGTVVARGDLVMGEDSVIRTDPEGGVSFKGDTVTILGSVFAPGGTISVTGASNSSAIFGDAFNARPTVYIGSKAILSAAGTTVYQQDPYGRRIGRVLPGGSITVSGNIAASGGAILDVSGASAILDLAPTVANVSEQFSVAANSGLTAPLRNLKTVPTQVDSDGGSITLKGGQLLFSDATLLGRAGGPTALGGSLTVSSSRFYLEGATASPLDVNLVVTQEGNFLPVSTGDGNPIGKILSDTNGIPLAQMGHFAVSRFAAGGFDSFELGGVVRFVGPVDIAARGKLTVASGGVLYADSAVTLSAPYVKLGLPFAGPVPLEEKGPPFGTAALPIYAPPSFGPGSLTVRANLIDVGTLSLQNIGRADLIADGGDIRGDGVLNIAGDLYMRAAQIYPNTAVSFTISAYDHGGIPGSVTIAGSGVRSLPLSAGGTLSIYASVINQGGVLRAPFGQIRLGSDGTGTAIDPLSGQLYPTAQLVTLGDGSLTSVSAIDPLTGKGVLIPYGLNLNGTSWIDPTGLDITAGGVPQKMVSIAGLNVDIGSGSLIDIRGGGDLYAYRWVSGVGGTEDVLASTGSFAVLPGYLADYAPYAPNTSSANATDLGGDPGYVNGNLKVGDRVYLGASSGLAAGVYTLLPARYALLPGAVLVTPQSGTPMGTIAMADGSSIVSGYRYNGLNSSRAVPTIASRFEVAPASVVRSRSEYEDYYGSDFLRQGATAVEASVPRLPVDGGQLILQASQSMNLQGRVLAQGALGGRGGLVDIASPVDIFIGGPGVNGGAGVLTLSASQLSGFGAESLLIGGIRTATSNGTTVAVRTSNITVDNAGAPLSAPDVILAAKQSLTLAAGAEVYAEGYIPAADVLLFGDAATPGSGNGTLLRVTNADSAGIIRSGVTSVAGPQMTIGAGASIGGQSLVLDSTYATSLDPSANLIGSNISLNSGQVSLLFENPGAVQPTVGLVLSGGALRDLEGAQALSLLSYSTIDIYGTGQFSTQGRLALHAGEIRGFNNGGGTISFKAPTILLDNSPGQSGVGAVTGLAGTLELDARTIEIGANQVKVDQFANLVLKAPGGILANGSGGLTTQGHLLATTSLITTGKSATQSLTAGGDLIIQDVGGVAPTVSGGLGGSLTLTGASVSAASDIILPSGLLALRATTGDLQIAGLLDVGGTKQAFYDLDRFTDAGRVSLTADAGNVILTADSSVNVAAHEDGGSAGTLAISTPAGSFALGGTIRGSGGAGGKNGSFVLDIGSLPNFGALGSVLSAADLTEAQSFRIRTGNVLVDGLFQTHAFHLAADQGSITVGGIIDASGVTGGSINLQANGNVTLLGGSLLSVAGEDFSSAGKGGSVTLEAGSQRNGVVGAGSVDIQAGSVIDLSVASKIAGDAGTPGTSAYYGQFSGKLHIRAPQNAAGTDLLVNPINGTIVDASSILVEGYRLYDLTNYGGAITSTVQANILADGNSFLGAAGTTTANYTAMMSRLFANNSGLVDVAVLAPGAELINMAQPTSLSYNLTAVGSLITIPATGGSILFPSGTPGNNTIRSTAAGTITSASGVVTTLAANTNTVVAPGSTVTLALGGSISFASGSGGAIPVTLAAGSSYTTGSTGVAGTVTGQGSMVTLNTAGTSAIALATGSRVTFPSGTPGNNTVRATVAGTITSATGVVTAFAANTNITVAAGSYVSLNTAGTITFASGSGGAIPVALASGSFTTSGATTLTPATGNITLGTATSTTTSDWDLSGYRFGAKSASGVLTMRAAGNLVFYNALSDGFTPTLASSNTSWLYQARPTNQNPLLPINTQSWAYRLVAGADFGSVDFGGVRPLSQLAASSGSLQLGKDNGANSSNSNGQTNAPGTAALTSLALANRYQVIRTGSGDIDIRTGRSVQLLNQFATIYTAGTQLASSTMDGEFSNPSLNQSGGDATLGANQQPTAYPARYTMAGGNVNIQAQENIEHLTKVNGVLVADSQRELPNNWLYRRGYIDPATGNFGIGRFNDVASTTWWVDFSNFFQGIGALGGGDVTLLAGQDISNVDAVIPTNARMKGRDASLNPIAPDADNLVELGGGDLLVQAGRNIDAGVYYLERGVGTLSAGKDIITNSTRSPSTTILTASNLVRDSHTWLPTTLFLGKGGFNVSARGNVLLGPVANPFLLPQGINNTYWYKTYFSTYASDSFVNVSSLGGSVTLRQAAALNGGTATPLLQIWAQQQQLLTTSPASASYYQPWLRLAESSVSPFATVVSLLPGTVRATSFSGDVNLVGDLTLSPSSVGTIELLAAGSINGLQPNGSSVLGKNWGSSVINVSDANPNAIPGITSPFAYQTLVGTNQQQAIRTNESLNFLTFIDRLFDETGSTDSVIDTKQALHAAGLLHKDDPEPLRLYASTGNISGLELFAPKFSQIFAGRDITDIAFYIQNLDAEDTSIVASGRDIIPSTANSLLRVSSRATGNVAGTLPLAGDIQIAGPGALEVLAGRNLDLGTGADNGDGTGVGITSIGNARNPYLSFAGADVVVGSGIGMAMGLSDSDLNIDQFLAEFLGDVSLEGEDQSPEGKARLALKAFYHILRDVGRQFATEGTSAYETGFAAIDALFGTDGRRGDILTRARDIRTKSGGDIMIFAPGGKLTMASSTIGNPKIPPGIVTESGGDISIFTKGSVDIGIGRIFTLRGGNAIIWSSTGDIAAGRSATTVKSAPPTRVLIDPQSADVQTDLAGLATGGGIGVLATVAGVPAGDVDLIAPQGAVDAGDAGIRVSGNLNIAATRVLNASNISVGGATTGVPSAPTVAAPNIAGLTAASTTAGAGANAANEMANHARTQAEEEEEPSIITVEVLGYGGEEDTES